MAIKAKANKLMKLVNIKGKTQMKSTISHHQEEHKLFILFLFKHDNHFLEEQLLVAIQNEKELIEDITLHLKWTMAVIKAFLEQAALQL